MTNLEWTTWFPTGHQRIDFEHRLFLDRIDDPARKVSAEVHKYAAFHFLSEQTVISP